jgi:hypothetical protein
MTNTEADFLEFLLMILLFVLMVKLADYLFKDRKH